MNEIGIVLAGGTGSRLLPLTRTVNKHLLPVNGRPMLHWPLRTLAMLGVERAIVVLGGRSCGEVVEHFGTRYDTGEGTVISLVYVYQDGAGGIPAALREAYPAAEAMRAARVVVVLGDNVFPALPAGLRDALDEAGGEAAVVLARQMPDASSYGCVALDAEGRVDLTAGLIEKPKDAPPAGRSWAAVLGFYAFPMWGLAHILRRLAPSARGELEIVDVLDFYRRQEGALRVLPTTAAWIDAGDPPGYALANDPAFWQAAPGSDLRGLAERVSAPPPVVPTHRCRVCGALWRLWTKAEGGGWSLASETCGPCCDNAAMGDQIEPLPSVAP